MIKQQNMAMEDTICAISTGTGSAGIGIVRLSGPDAITIAERIFRSISNKTLTQADPGKMLYGYIVDPVSEKKIDEVLVLKLQAPHSYTAEDTIEINCHGGLIPTKKILELLLTEGARLAQPGEFTKRAFLNGRIDLTQAESVMDVISSKSERALEVSTNQLSGSLKERIKKIDSLLIDTLVLIDSNLDYPEYDIEEITNQKVTDRVEEALDACRKILKYGQNSSLLREGVKTAIIGKPNVGKSSLLNYFMGEERAIVTDIPGTTRDTIVENIVLDGIPFILTDTAGIHETEDHIEKIGIEKSLKAVDAADLVLFMHDSTEELDQEEIELIEKLRPERSLFILNKIDQENNVSRETFRQDWLEISLKEERGIEALEKAMVEKAGAGASSHSDNSIMLNQRQEDLIRRIVADLNQAIFALENHFSEEVYAVDITAAEEKLREITGERIGEDVIDEIFSRFCIGK